MTLDIRDREALLVVSPGALSAYARAAGWAKAEEYGDHSDIYVSGQFPEIILPRHQRLGDYASVVWRLIGILAKAAEVDEGTLYRDLVTADRDIVRLRAPEDEDGGVNVGDGVTLLGGARDMLLAAACSLRKPRPFYRVGANKVAKRWLKRFRMGHTEQGSFVITLLSPVIPPPTQLELDWRQDHDQIERRITRRLAVGLNAVRQATEETDAGDAKVAGDADAFSMAVKNGVSANLCEALAGLLNPFRVIDVTLTWARTFPEPQARNEVRFAASDAPILLEAARSLRSQEPLRDMTLVGFVRMLRRDQAERGGSVTLRASIDGKYRSVKTVLNQSDYDRAVLAHKDETQLVVKGDLQRVGQRWELINPSVVERQ